MHEELERFKKRVMSLKENAYQGRFVLLPFLDETFGVELKNCFKKNEVIQPYFYGGYADAEYRRCIIAENEPNKEDFQITILKVCCSPRNGVLSHRSILGSILGLGLKRDVVGDIVGSEEVFYVFVNTKMADFIKENLFYVGNIPVEIEISNVSVEIKKEFIIKRYFVSSMRLDVIIAAFYNLSRKESLEIIKNADVKRNHLLCQNPSQIIVKDDIISVRHKGRIYVGDSFGVTKSGNIVLELKKPC